MMDLSYSLLIGLLVTILLLALVYPRVYLSTITRAIGVWITWYRDVKHLRSLPSPTPRHWLWGHALEIGPTLKTMLYIQENHKKYPKWCVYWIGPFIPFVFTADVEIMKIILQQPGESPRPPSYRFFYKWLGDGLFTSSGAKWRRHRKMLTPAFHFDILKQYIPVYNEVSHKLVEIWSGLADSGESVEITEYLHSYTLDVLLRCMYSSNSNCLEKEEVPYVMANNELAKLMIERVFTPHYAIDWIYFNTTAGRQFLHYCDVVHKFSEGVIVQRREELLKETQLSQPTRRYQDFLDILLSAKDENGEGLTDTEIRKEVDTFMLAGYETTATALGWALYCLAMYKEHQEMCRKEIREVLAGRDYITWEDLSKLSYTIPSSTILWKEIIR
ncbi:cytochrome P450 4B1-like [Dysidea avara]|uniref:cytochrome P450 4B1-like n=1 Tax=Dysidea avara TaxID=196820 RepID=UPI00332E314D